MRNTRYIAFHRLRTARVEMETTKGQKRLVIAALSGFAATVMAHYTHRDQFVPGGGP
jgi:hypothetical protein